MELAPAHIKAVGKLVDQPKDVFTKPSLSTGIKVTTEANDDLLQAKRKAKNAVNEFVTTVAHAIIPQIT